MEHKILFRQGALWSKLQLFKQRYLNDIPTMFERTVKGSARVAHPMLIGATGKREQQSPSKSLRSPAMLRKIAAMFLLLLTFGIGNVWGEGTESFENLSSATNYASRSWTGDNGQSGWAATNARTDQKVSGSRGLCFKASTASTITMKLTNDQKNAGIGVLSFKYKFPYSDSSKSRVLSITIGSDTYSSGTLSYGSSSSYNGSITINSALTSNTITIDVDNGGARICVDDFSWTSNSAASCSDPTGLNNSSSKRA